MREAKEDPNLAEVKAVLKELQRLDFTATAEHGSETSSKLQRQPSPSPGKANIGVFDRKRAALVKANRPRSARRTHLYFLTALILIGSGAAYLYATGLVGVPSVIGPKATLPQKEDDTKLLAESRRLLTEGDVILARTRLLKGRPETHAELALTLAQSYDPNYLRALSKANGRPDRVEAERWYRKWYELAVSSGLEMDSERLKRIINAMQ
jgi:hypothetical protein